MRAPAFCAALCLLLACSVQGRRLLVDEGVSTRLGWGRELPGRPLRVPKGAFGPNMLASGVAARQLA